MRSLVTAAFSGLAGGHGGEELLAVPLTLVLAGLVFGALLPTVAQVRAVRAAPPAGTVRRPAWPGRLSVLLGRDGRLSTSKTVAAVWTLVVGYVIVTLLLVWPEDWNRPLQNLYPTYLLLLGGPFAALVLSKGVVAARVSSGSLIKTSADGYARLGDLVSDDAGRTDLFDAQFVFFNVLAMWFVLAAFLHDVSNGLTGIPDGLALLTGGPSAVYLSNKIFGSDSVTVSSVVPERLTAGDTFVVQGSNFVGNRQVTNANGAGGAVLVNGRRAEVGPGGWTDSRIEAVAPSVGPASGGPLQVKVVTAAGATATFDGALIVDDRPLLAALRPGQARRGDLVTATVDWPADTQPGSMVRILLGEYLLTAPLVGPGPHDLAFVVPQELPVQLNGTDVDVIVRAAGPASAAAALRLLG